jgi:hypothetical protein
VYFPLRYYFLRYGRTDGHGYAKVTRFITADVCAAMEQRVLYDATEEVTAASVPAAQQEVTALLEGLLAG